MSNGSASAGVERTLTACPESVPEARRLLQPLRSIYPDRAVDDLALLVTELVTNEVRHGAGRSGGAIVLRVLPAVAGLRVEVTNMAPKTMVRIERRTAGPEGGYGLILVEQLAARWGIDLGEHLTVWAEMTV
jgi:anti-sigma regulatory factor (Ser/Thr protein kinase)